MQTTTPIRSVQELVERLEGCFDDIPEGPAHDTIVEASIFLRETLLQQTLEDDWYDPDDGPAVVSSHSPAESELILRLLMDFKRRCDRELSQLVDEGHAEVWGWDEFGYPIFVPVGQSPA